MGQDGQAPPECLPAPFRLKHHKSWIMCPAKTTSGSLTRSCYMHVLMLYMIFHTHYRDAPSLSLVSSLSFMRLFFLWLLLLEELGF